jgi:3-hydroxyacyl-CoA dehydrogenase / enoyl-CoA hydratase / 3-hydroxybutyryl-CoA epimerase
MPYKRISYEIKNYYAYIGFGYNCDKSMTVLDEESLKELRDIINEASNEGKNIKGVIFHSHKENCFLAGADIKLISAMKTESEGAHGAEQGQIIFNIIEDLKVPSIACVNGVCLGGGTELSLSCTTIICSNNPKTQIGLPEVKLGVIPGFGGTFRMPKKVGLPTALDLILTGKSLNSRKAKKVGLVSGVYPKERLLEMALGHLKKSKKSQTITESIGQFAADNFLSRKIIFQQARESVLKKTKGFYQAPLKILDVMEAGMMKGRTGYLAGEAQAFGELCVGEQSKNLQHLFFLMEASKKYEGPKAENDIPDLKRGAALGAGTMGGGIAWLMAESDMAPILKDLTPEALELGLKQSAANFLAKVKRKKMTFNEFERKQRTISPELTYQGFGQVDLVIEAIIENMDIKKSVFAEVEKHVTKSCILTSNTSSLRVTEMATALEYPERFAGLHFFNPVNRMPLVEIVTHDKVSPETIEALYAWCLKANKTPVVVGDGPGFLVNRILMPYLNEVGFLLKEGVSMKDVDEACLNFGMPMGPCRLLDEIGLDVGVKVAKILHAGLGERAATSDLSQIVVDKGFLGKKNNKGFFLYDDKGKVTGENEEVQNLLPNRKIKMSETDIQMRVFLPMINEASIILDDKIVSKASDVDLALIFGIGFPPFRGGLLKYADGQGLDRILDAINKYSNTVSDKRYKASEYLINLVDKKIKFYDI